MKKYRTHLIVNLKDSQKIDKLCFEDFQLVLKPEPTKSYWESKDGSSYSHVMQGDYSDFISEAHIPQNELLIECENEDQAEDIISLIQGGMLLAFPEPSIINNLGFISDYSEVSNDRYVEQECGYFFKRLSDVGFGCEVANLAYKKTEICYSIEKYKISLGLKSFSPHSIDPIYGQIFDHHFTMHNFHANAAFAIISGFSVIEELDLDIRSSNKKHRFINNETGEWNPLVLSDIVERLEKSGISDKMTFDWVYRGNPTRVENELKPFFGFDSEWTIYGEDVRDKTLTFPEAIHNASYLRNYFAAHKFNELTQFISPYDVFNVQSLARELILNKLGLWEVMLNRNKKNCG
jgi:hypothetical protein